jgi:hypothetical protein
MGLASAQVSVTGAASSPRRWSRDLLPVLVLILATVTAYYPVHFHPFSGIDDPSYVTNEPRVQRPLDGSAVVWAFTHPFFESYDPLIFIAHSVNVRLFQLNPAGHHDVNLAWHVLDAVLLFLVLKGCTGYAGRSFMVAALFALHPINVENVAWIAELKTLLSTAFLLLALGAYHRYALRPNRARMSLVALLYTMGLLAKPQVITLPFLLLLWDYWPLRRLAIGLQSDNGTKTGDTAAPAGFFTLVREKSVLFILAFVDAMLTLMAEGKAHPRDWPFTFTIRLGNAILSYARYLGKAFWPIHLGYLYPHPGYSLSWVAVGWSFLLLSAITMLVLVRQKQRYLSVGWFWFLGSLVPMIGLVQINLPALADRWAYNAFIGIFIMVCWTVADWAQANALRRRLVQVVSVTVLLVLASRTRHQVGFWSDDMAMWQHSSEINQHYWIAEQMVGNLFAQRGEMKQALPHWYRAVADVPENRAINLAIADGERQAGNLELAINYYGKVLAFADDDPQNAQAWINMGLAYSALGDNARASACYAQGQRLRALPPPKPGAVDWQGAWWNDISRYLHRRWQQFRSHE